MKFLALEDAEELELYRPSQREFLDLPAIVVQIALARKAWVMELEQERMNKMVGGAGA